MATTVVYRETRRKYRWPEVQLNLWIFVILAASSTVLGIFAWFMVVQRQLEVGIPWYVFTMCVNLEYPNTLQAIPFRNRYCCVDVIVSPLDPHSGSTEDAYTWDNITMFIHTFRSMVDYVDRNGNTTFWARWQCELQLQCLRFGPRVSRYIS